MKKLFICMYLCIGLLLVDGAWADSHGEEPSCSSQQDVRGFSSSTASDPNLDLTIGMIQAGNYSQPKNRLEGLGYTVSLLPPDSGFNTFQHYDIVYLPVQWAEQGYGDYDTLDLHATEYHAYVQAGGNLFVDQPNPYKQPNHTVSPSLLPYPITFYSTHRVDDWPPLIVNPNHDITLDLSAEEMPWPADQVSNVDSQYEILVKGGSSGLPSLLVAEYGNGRILIQTSYPSDSATYPFSDEVYIRMVNWLGTAREQCYTQEDIGDAYAAGYAAGRQSCIDDPVSCGIQQEVITVPKVIVVPLR